jgi:hypothetical protein
MARRSDKIFSLSVARLCLRRRQLTPGATIPASGDGIRESSEKGKVSVIKLLQLASLA